MQPQRNRFLFFAALYIGGNILVGKRNPFGAAHRIPPLPPLHGVLRQRQAVIGLGGQRSGLNFVVAAAVIGQRGLGAQAPRAFAPRP